MVTNVPIYNPRKNQVSLPYSMSFFDSESIHLITRHPHKTTTQGYLAPLSFTCLLYVTATGLMINAAKDFAGRIFSLADKVRGGKYFSVAFAVAFFAFSLFYNQDLISSTIEAQYESLPDHLEDIDIRSDRILGIGNIHFFQLIQWLNLKVMPEYLERRLDISLLFRNIALSPHHFAIMSKRNYYDNVLGFPPIFTNRTDTDDSIVWEWRISPVVSRYVLNSVVYLKYAAWLERFNLQLIKFRV